MRTEFELSKDDMKIRGYYDIEKCDALLFYNFNGDDIGSRYPINPFSRSHEHEKHKTFEEIKTGVMNNYNTLKSQVKSRKEVETRWYELKILNEEIENDSPF